MSPPQDDWLNGIVSDYLVGLEFRAYKENGYFIVEIRALAEEIEMKVLADWIIENAQDSGREFLALKEACCKELGSS